MNKRSLTFQLTAYLVVVCSLILMGASFLYYRYSEGIIRRHIEAQTRQAVDSSAQYLNQYLDTLKSTTDALATNSEVITFATKQASNQADHDQIQALLATLLKTHSQFVSVLLITQDGRVLSNGPVDDMVTSRDMMTQPWYQDAIQEGAMPHLTGSRMEADKWVVSVSQPIQDWQGRNIGVARLDIDYHAMATYLSQLHLGQDGYAFIMNGHDQVVYSPHQSDFEDQMTQANLVRLAHTKDGYTADGNYLYHVDIQQSDWILVGVSTLTELRPLAQQLMQQIAWTLLVLVVLIGGLIYGLLGRSLQSLKHLEQTMAQVSQGQTQLQVEEQGAQEFRQLAQHFNRMVQNIEGLMAEAKVQEQEIRTYELKALSSQINPHFLYNTLDTIVWMAEFNDSSQVVAMTQALAQYFRLALNQGNEVIAFEKEIDHVRQYLYIQSQRYGDQLTYSIEEESELSDFQLPKLVLQPLVENAVYHGIKEKGSPGHVRVVSRRLNSDQVALEVWDDGPGFGYSRLSNRSPLGGVGLANVERRLKLYYGNDFQLLIHSQAGQETCVSLLLPIKAA